ncbi:cyclopropane-fatty-acyl-phospholipid synthase-like protein [Leptotrombidium deliense]|uniref:Cyclopropane-fatty-acyl-phospholipid synthase-like protein n=1 Tax=Leptotrombidium deliense TaxID=299467 RepID=A0A443S5W4_9ACAR|nr:cyclopropane-fatty-acyl-phospholipid synthase-like protein [Leptotrombidium deliense]
MFKLLKYFAFYTISLLLELFRITIYYSVIPFVPLIKYFIEEELKRNDIHDFTVKDDRIFQMIASSPIIGFMQAYINGYFECNNLLQLHEKLAKSRMTAVGFLHPYNFIKSDLKYYLRLQNQESAYEDGGKGYDVNIELIEKLFIGDCHGISCPYFRGAETLEEAYTESSFVIEDWQNYGNHFAIAFEKLYERIESQKDAVINKYGVQFYRGVQISNAMAYSGFLSRRAHVWHIVFSKNGIFGGYDSEN